VRLLPTNFQRSWIIFFGVSSKKGLNVFSANVSRHFVRSNNVGRHFCPDFQGFCPDFQQIKTFGGALSPPASTSPTPLTSLAPCRSYLLISFNVVEFCMVSTHPCYVMEGFGIVLLPLLLLVHSGWPYAIIHRPSTWLFNVFLQIGLCYITYVSYSLLCR